jgi:hypothetical protein
MMVGRCLVTPTIVITTTLYHFLVTVLCFHRVLGSGLLFPNHPSGRCRGCSQCGWGS